MPTDNRSSNTEMVSVPRDEVERLVKLLQYQAHPYPSPHAAFWQGLLDAPAAQHQAEGYSAGDMADQGAKAFAARDGEVEEFRQALGGMLFAFDDGVGKSWSQDLLDYARKLTPAAEFKPAD